MKPEIDTLAGIEKSPRGKDKKTEKKKQGRVQIPVGVTLTAEQYQQLAQNSNKSLEAAKVFIALVPMLIVYPFLQKYFVTGITLGAVKE